MGMPARAITRDFVASVNVIDKASYIEAYVAAKLATNPGRPYTASTIFDEYLDIWAKPRRAVIDQLERDSNLVVGDLLPLSPLADLRLPYVEELPYFITRSIYERSPLISGETIQTAATLYLRDDWAGLGRGTFFFRRETNFSNIYFALPDIRWNLETGALLPSNLFPPGENRVLVAVAAEAAATTSDDSSANTELAQKIINGALEVIGTLSWATPAGPFVSAGVFIIEAILGATLGQGQGLAEGLKKMGEQIVGAVTRFQEYQELKKQINAVNTFAKWLESMNTELNTQDPAAFRSTLLQPGGTLFQLNQNINGNSSESLFGIVGALQDDGDLGAPQDGSDGAYQSKERFELAQSKLAILAYATSMYVLALKLKVSLLARLCFYGYDALGKPIKDDNNPDTTVGRMREEVPKLMATLTACGAHLKTRRRAMIGERAARCLVAYSKNVLPASQRSQWHLGDHDGLYTGPYKDQLVRDLNDHPSEREFESGYIDKEQKEYGVLYHAWQRHEIIDRGLDDGKGMQDFVADNCQYGGWSYVKDSARVDRLRARHAEKVSQLLDKVLKIPNELNQSLETLLSRWTPQIPERLPDGRPFIAAWRGKSLKDELWADSHVDVRYLFRLVGTAQRPSVMSNDDNSTLWQKAFVEGEARCKPEIKAIPISGDFMEYVTGIHLYRQFKRGEKVGAPRLVAKLERDKDTGKFKTDSFIDEITTEYDKPALMPGNGWLPKIPEQLPERPAIEEWGGKPRHGELWADPEIEVRYLFSLVTSDGRESAKSSDGASSVWTRAEQRSGPQITVPDGESFLEFATLIRFYRQFRKGKNAGEPRLVKTLERGEINGRFPASFRDIESTQDDVLK